ncbi:MAG: hypothetical protein R8G33_08755 [Gammaproteobacteria bacterium]|nr:hypothetical protein [Gammaproteobacteria bacterium]
MSRYFLTFTKTLCVFLLASAVSMAIANPSNAIEVSSIVELEVISLDEQGNEIIKRIPAEKVTPGSEVIYTTRFKHNGAEPAEDIVISNPIPEHTIYKVGSAKGNGTETLYSVDGGKSFHQRDQLTVVGQDGSNRVAEAKDYTDIRWTYKGKLQPGDEGTVEFRVVLK